MLYGSLLAQLLGSRGQSFHAFSPVPGSPSQTQYVVRSITGHVTERMTEHYSHIETEEKQQAVNSVLRLFSPGARGPESGPEGGLLAADPKKKTSQASV